MYRTRNRSSHIQIIAAKQDQSHMLPTTDITVKF